MHLGKICSSVCFTLIVSSFGCYSYSEATLENVAPGANVRARVLGSEADRLEAVTGRYSRVIEGSLVENTGEELLLSVRSGGGAVGSSASGLRQRLTIPESAIVEFETRRLDVWRTAALAAVGAGLAAYVAYEALDVGDSSPAEGPKNGGNASLRILVPIRF